MLSPLLSVLMLGLPQSPTHSDPLPLNQWSAGKLTIQNGQAQSAQLTSLSPDSPHYSKAYIIQVPHDGIYSCQLRSYTFDAYLILKDPDGNILAENDDGGIGTHAQLSPISLRAGIRYQLLACSVHGGTGWFEVALHTDAAPSHPVDEDVAKIQDLLYGVDWLKSKEGEFSPMLESPLSSLVFLLWKQRRFQEALPYAQQAVDLARHLHGDQHVTTAFAFSNLAAQYSSLDQSELAAKNYRLAYGIYCLKESPTSERALRSLRSLCQMLNALRDFQALNEVAVPAYLQMVEDLPAGDPRFAEISNYLGPSLLTTGHYVEAVSHYRTMLEYETSRPNPNRHSIAVRSNNLAHALIRSGDQIEAELLMREALDILMEVSGPEDRNTLATLGNLGAVLWNRGMFHQAEPIMRQAADTKAKVQGEEHPDTVSSLFNLASVYSNLDRLVEAEAILQRVVATYKANPEVQYESEALAMGLLSDILLRLGRTEEGLRMVEAALVKAEAHYGPSHPNYAIILSHLGGYYYKIKNFAKAKPIFERILSIKLSRFGPDAPALIQTYSNLGTTLHGLGDLQAAENSLREAVRLAELAFGPNNPRTAGPLGNLTAFFYRQDKLNESTQLARRVLKIHVDSVGENSLSAAKSRMNLAVNLLETKHISEALDQAEIAYQSLYQYASESLWMMAESDGFAFLLDLERSIEVLLAATLLVDTPGAHNAALAAVGRWKGMIGRSFTGASMKLQSELTPKQAEWLGEIQQIQELLSRMAFRRDISNLGSHAAKMENLQLRKLELERKLNSARADATILAGPSAQDAHARLPKASAWIEFLVHPHFIFATGEPGAPKTSGFNRRYSVSAWVSLPGEPNAKWIDLGDYEDLRLEVEQFLRSYTAKRGGRLIKSGNAVYDDRLKKRLFDPLLPHLNGVSQIFISPDSFLATLPFEVLCDDNGRYLIEDYSFIYLNGMNQLPTGTVAQRDPPRSLLTIGGVDYNRTPSPTGTVSKRGGSESFWGRLTHTDYEAQVVADIFQVAAPDAPFLHLTGSEAQEARVKEELVGTSHIHLATHGFFESEGAPSLWQVMKNKPDSENEMDLLGRAQNQNSVGISPSLLSGLVCAGANQSEEDGLLTAGEVQWIDLSGADLVVLSACETGLGQQQAGEGMMSLRRAFHLAGAETVISSLWSVNDKSTQRLMQEFYQNLWLRNQGTLEALRNAQLTQLEHNRRTEKDPLPWTWGAFVLSGDWR